MRILLRSIAFVALFAFVVLLCRTGSAGEKVQSGKELYKQNCRVCQDNGSPHGEYSPSTLIADNGRGSSKRSLCKLTKTCRSLDSQGRKCSKYSRPSSLR